MNSFGTRSQQSPLVDPRCVREHRQRFRRDLFPELDLANSYYSLAGRWPDVGWLLIDRASYDRLDPYSTELQLVIADFVNQPVTINYLSVVQARCVTYGLATDPDALYLVQVTNDEGVLYNQWFQYPVSAQYNIRAPAYDGTYYSGSLTGANNTDAWTWDGMVGDLWGRAGGLLGAYPGLPVVPDGAPEEWSFVGVPLLGALTAVLDYLGLSLAGSYPSHTIVVPGAADAAYAALVAKYAATTSPNFCLEDSMEYLDVGSGRVPGTVVVEFHRRNAVYGSEETVRYDAPQWQNVPSYRLSITAPAPHNRAAGTGHLWSGFTVRYDQEGNPLLADALEAQAIAQELVVDYFNRIHRGTQGCARATYAGALPFTTGSLVDGVRWFNTGKLGGSDDRWCGWRTEVIRGYEWDEVGFSLKGTEGAG